MLGMPGQPERRVSPGGTLTGQKQTVSGGHRKQTRGCCRAGAGLAGTHHPCVAPAVPAAGTPGRAAGRGVGRVRVPHGGEEPACSGSQPGRDQGRFQPAVSATQISVVALAY